jgi:hypothetical protein
MKLPACAISTLLVLVATTSRASAFAPSTTTTTATTTTAHRSCSSRLMAVSRKDSYDITLLPGDGIGPEIMSATKSVLAALTRRCNFELRTTDALIGGAAIDAVNDPFPDESLKQCLSSDSVLLSCIGGYKWDANPRHLRPESGLLKMRKSMGLFANLRPAKVLSQLVDASTLKREIVEGVDIMVVRELTGDVYFGTPKGIDVIDGELSVLVVERGKGRGGGERERERSRHAFAPLHPPPSRLTPPFLFFIFPMNIRFPTHAL